jgi:hypothetical protein
LWRIEAESLGTSMQMKSILKKWLQFLKEWKISFCQNVPKSMVLTNYEDEDNLWFFQALK